MLPPQRGWPWFADRKEPMRTGNSIVSSLHSHFACTHLLRRLAVLVFLFLGIGCAGPSPTHTPLKIDRQQLEDDVPSLLARADRVYLETRALRPTALAAAGLEKALEKEPNNADILWRAARIHLTLARILEERTLRRKFADLAYSLSQRGIAVAPDKPESYYFLSASAGIRATLTRTPTMEVQRQVEEPAEQLRSLDPEYAEAGALRILGAMYATAPAWPVGIGDLDEAIELLEEAVKRFPAQPLNHYFLGEAYLKANRFRDGIRELREVLAIPVRGIWEMEGIPYRKRALRLIRDHQESP